MRVRVTEIRDGAITDAVEDLEKFLQGLLLSGGKHSSEEYCVLDSNWNDIEATSPLELEALDPDITIDYDDMTISVSTWGGSQLYSWDFQEEDSQEEIA